MSSSSQEAVFPKGEVSCCCQKEDEWTLGKQEQQMALTLLNQIPQHFNNNDNNNDNNCYSLVRHQTETPLGAARQQESSY